MKMEKKEGLAFELIRLSNEYKKLDSENYPMFERGIAEASVERELKVWDDLLKVFNTYDIIPSLNLSFLTDNVQTFSGRPQMTCTGIRCNVTYVIYPIDKEGKSGKYPKEVVDRMKEIQMAIGEINKELTDEQ